VSLQQIAYMQALGRPQMPWYVNSEKQHQMGRAYLSPNDMPTLSYQRVDVRFGEDTDHAGVLLPDTAHALRGKKVKSGDLKGLKNIANSKRRNSELLTDLGEKAGARFIQNAAPPHEFDHSAGQWTRIGQEGPGSQRG
jgi:hypothetical protein